MRYKYGTIFQKNLFADVAFRTLWLASAGYGWLGEAFLGLSFILLCQARKFESPRDTSKGEKGILLSGDNWGIGDAMLEMKMPCPSCKRLVEILYPIANVRRCEDCAKIAERNGIQFDKAMLN